MSAPSAATPQTGRDHAFAFGPSRIAPLFASALAVLSMTGYRLRNAILTAESPLKVDAAVPFDVAQGRPRGV